MPMYYFDVYNDDVTSDDEGAELVDEHAARIYAINEAPALAAHTVKSGHLVRSHRIDIRDANQVIIDSVSFEEAVDIRT